MLRRQYANVITILTGTLIIILVILFALMQSA
jgi:hypothetical protein